MTCAEKGVATPGGRPLLASFDIAPVRRSRWPGLRNFFAWFGLCTPAERVPVDIKPGETVTTAMTLQKPFRPTRLVVHMPHDLRARLVIQRRRPGLSDSVFVFRPEGLGFFFPDDEVDIVPGDVITLKFTHLGERPRRDITGFIIGAAV